MSAFQTLIEHCRETHPHFESPRGQADIAAAIQEHYELIAALKLFLPLATDAKCIKSIKWSTARNAARAVLSRTT